MKLPEATFEYRTRLVEGEMGFLEWSGRSASTLADDGADSYLIRDGRIVAQTIHYTVRLLQQAQAVNGSPTEQWLLHTGTV